MVYAVNPKLIFKSFGKWLQGWSVQRSSISIASFKLPAFLRVFFYWHSLRVVCPWLGFKFFFSRLMPHIRSCSSSIRFRRVAHFKFIFNICQEYNWINGQMFPYRHETEVNQLISMPHAAKFLTNDKRKTFILFIIDTDAFEVSWENLLNFHTSHCRSSF